MIRCIVVALAALFCLGSDCKNAGYDLSPLAVTMTRLNDGMNLRVTWQTRTPPPEEVQIYVDEGMETVKFSDYGFDVPGPAHWVSVCGRYYSDPSYTSTRLVEKDFMAVVTPALTLYPASDINPEHAAHGLLISRVDGGARAVAYDDPDRVRCAYALVDSGDSLFLVAGPDLQYRGSFWSATAGLAVRVEEDFDNLKTCPDGSAGWSRRVRLVAGETYALDASGSALSGFAKMRVEEINGKGVTLSIGVQKIQGLRWVITTK